MKRSLPLLGELLLAAAVLAAAAAFAVPVAPRELPPAGVSAPPGEPVPEAAALPSAARTAASPQQVAALFGWREAPAAKPAAVKPAAPAKPAPPRLKQVGFVESEDGTASWVFKDTQAGSVVTLSLGATSRGWTLVEVRKGEFLLTFQGTTHTIPRSR